MIKNTIYLENKNYPELTKLACVACNDLIISTELGNIVLKEYNQIQKMEIPNSDPYYQNVRNLYYTTHVGKWKCDFIVSIQDTDILQALLTPAQFKKATNNELKAVFNRLSDIQDFYRYIPFKKIMRQDKHVILKVADSKSHHIYYFDNVIYNTVNLTPEIDTIPPIYKILNHFY